MTTINPKFREIAFAGLIAALVTPLIFSFAFAVFTILDRPANYIAPLGEQSLIKAAEVFAAEDLRAVVDLYEARPGNYASVDQAAIDAIFARYPQATQENRDALIHYAMLLTR